MLANFSSETLTILKAIVLGIAEEMIESVIYRINNERQSNSGGPKKPPRRKKNEKQIYGKLDGVVEHRAGSKVGQVDALSHHVGTVIHGGTSDKENVPSERAKDASCTKQILGTQNALIPVIIHPKRPGPGENSRTRDSNSLSPGTEQKLYSKIWRISPRR